MKFKSDVKSSAKMQIRGIKFPRSDFNLRRVGTAYRTDMHSYLHIGMNSLQRPFENANLQKQAQRIKR